MAWPPLWGHGEIDGAKAEEKAVYYVGHVLLDRGAIPLAFDAKETVLDNWPLSGLSCTNTSTWRSATPGLSRSS